MLRKDFQELAKTRLREARKLNKHGEYSGAYHLAGLAVECALKSRIAKQTKKYEFPDKKKASDAFDHDLERLVKSAGIKPELDTERKDPTFDLNWTIVKDWKVESRCEVIGREKSKDLYSAISARKHGVMQWIRKHW